MELGIAAPNSPKSFALEGVEGRKEEEYDSEERGKEERGGGCFNILSKPGLGYGGKKDTRYGSRMRSKLEEKKDTDFATTTTTKGRALGPEQKKDERKENVVSLMRSTEDFFAPLVGRVFGIETLPVPGILYRYREETLLLRRTARILAESKYVGVVFRELTGRQAANALAKQRTEGSNVDAYGISDLKTLCCFSRTNRRQDDNTIGEHDRL
ncbi:hypothetical protein V1477_013657 [Vespula maculifrons]|uniref:Uncharacterized protein n=1 Tax=Vespula maculifrons TaxID=7453 RepID=A0ABD2BNW6_VESMC